MLDNLTYYEVIHRSSNSPGGGGEIRTPEELSPLPVFETGSFGHSDTPPLALLYLNFSRMFRVTETNFLCMLNNLLTPS